MGKRYLCALFLTGATAQSLAADEVSLEMGRMIANEYCVTCHNIEPDGPFKMEPPSFAAIAKYRTKEQIRWRIVKPIHEQMPKYIDYMIGGNIDDMVAYIQSLE